MSSLGELVEMPRVLPSDRARESRRRFDIGVNFPLASRSRFFTKPSFSTTSDMHSTDVRSRTIVFLKYLNDAAPEDIGRFIMMGSLRRSKLVMAR